MTARAWLTQDIIPGRQVVAISLPDNEKWRADFLGTLLLLTQAENWEEFGTLTPDQMAEEWLEIWIEFARGQTTMLPIGTILEYGGEVLPDDFLWCRGEKVSRTTYSELFAVFGIKFGPGNGTTTFTLPDKRGQTGFGFEEGNNKFDPIGLEGGKQNHTLTVNELPVFTVVQNAHTHIQDAHNHGQSPHSHGQSPHGHTAYGSTTNAGSGIAIRQLGVASGNNDVLVQTVEAINLLNTATNQATTATEQSAIATNQAIGGGQAHTNLPPYQVFNYIVKYR